MPNTLCSVLAITLAAGLAALPVNAAPNRAIGFVLQAQGAQLSGSAAVNGTNLYSGDVFGTDAGGALRLQILGGQVYLLGSSAATLSENNSSAVTSLATGTAGFLTSQGKAVELRALDVTVRPKTAESTHAQVTVFGPQELLVRSFQGALELELDGQAYEVPSGKSYRVQIQSGDQVPQSMEAGRHPARRNRNLVLILFTGPPLAYLGMFIYHELTESPDKP